jgi:general secretion pathway protein D
LQSGEIAVHAKIEISSLGASLTVGGVSEPTFGQRVIEDDFRLVEGEVNLLGGLIQSTINAIVTGVPGLGDVPLVKLLFSNQHREVNDQEVLVMLTPSIIRLPEPALATGAGMPVRGGGEGGPAGPPEPFRPGEIRPEPPAQPQ